MSSDRIAAAFARAASERRAALVAYLTAYDGGFEHSLSCLLAAIDAGADVIELGVPFSDPSADGPTICAAMVRAREHGATLTHVLSLLAQLRAQRDTPVVLFGYANPLLRRGATRFADDARAAGADGVLVVDLPPESAAILREPVRAAGLHWIGLVAPTTSAARCELVARGASGFLYAITRAGTTGTALAEADSDEDAALRRQLALVRAATRLPVVAGFGVRTPEHVARLAPHAEGVVVGSALVEAALAGPSVLGASVRALREATAR
ncbi:MAG: tryptophan synthase subunit alpha [Nannocystaceae bacterium]|nr:tryptophan synthase subunit alpha [Nannocystaceae bacterium]